MDSVTWMDGKLASSILTVLILWLSLFLFVDISTSLLVFLGFMVLRYVLQRGFSGYSSWFNFTTPFSLVVSQPSIFCSCTMYGIAIIDVVEGKEPPPDPVSVPPAPEPHFSLRLFYIKRLVPQSVSYWQCNKRQD